MMRTHLASELRPEKHVKVGGWVDEVRVLGSISFILLRDGSGSIQVTAKKGAADERIFETIKGLKKEEVILVEGECVENKTAKRGIEIIPESIRVLSDIKEVLPIDMSTKIETTLEKRLDARCLDLRREDKQAIFKIQSMLIQEMQAYLKKNGFIQVFTPCLMGVASESGSEVFTVNYYDRKAFLRQDPQLHRQLTIAGGFEKIYDIGPSWRAELSHTTNHLSEHRTCAVEFAFIKDEYDVMKLEQDMVQFVLKRLMKDCKDELKLFNADLLVQKKFPVLEFPKLYDILNELGFKPVAGKESYSREGEKALGDYVREKYKSDFYFVNRFPFAEKPFYVMRYDDEPTWARSTDFMFRGIELSSGGQREHRYEKIIEQAKMKGMPLNSVEWFARFFKYGVPPHGGFALGLERLTMRLLNLPNIREAVLFPRDVDRLVP